MANADRPNILFVAHRVPYPPNRGDRIRSWNILRFLAERSNVYLACTTEEAVDTEDIAVLNTHCRRVCVESVSGAFRWGRAVLSLARGRSASEGLFASSPLQRQVEAWRREIAFDSTFVFCSSMYQFAAKSSTAASRLIVDLIDVDSQKWLDYAASAPPGKRQLYHLEARRVRQLEAAIANKADVVTLVSEQEVEVFRRFSSDGHVQAVPNGVDLDYFRPANEVDQNFSVQDLCNDSQQTGSKPFTLVFVGILNYRANVEGLRWFCENVWTKLRHRIPQVKLHIVGRHAGDSVRILARLPGVKLIGEVSDIRPSVWNADVVIAPLTIARGIQNKVLEAMAMAKPIIATPQAIEGTGARHGIHLLSATTPDEWVAALVELHESPLFRTSLGKLARDDAETRFSWEQRLASLESLVELRHACSSRVVARRCGMAFASSLDSSE